MKLYPQADTILVKLKTATSSSSFSSCHKGKNGRACGRHIKKTKETYGPTFAALGCLCRALLALGEESCCASPASANTAKSARMRHQQQRKEQQRQGGSSYQQQEHCRSISRLSFVSKVPFSTISRAEQKGEGAGGYCAKANSRSCTITPHTAETKDLNSCCEKKATTSIGITALSCASAKKERLACAKGCCGGGGGGSASKHTMTCKKTDDEGACCRGNSASSTKCKNIVTEKDAAGKKRCDGDTHHSPPVLENKQSGCTKGCCEAVLLSPIQKKQTGCTKGCCETSDTTAMAPMQDLRKEKKSSVCEKGCCVATFSELVPEKKESGCTKKCYGAAQSPLILEKKRSGCTKECCATRMAATPFKLACCNSDESDDCDDNNKEGKKCDSTSTCCKPSPLGVTVSEAELSTTAADLEKGLTSNGDNTMNHVVLAVTGMTCTGCETKLRRTLGTLAPAVTNLKTSLVLARAEFDLDSSKTLGIATGNGSNAAALLTNVLAHLKRTTEFSFEDITAQAGGNSTLAQLDLVVVVPDKNNSQRDNREFTSSKKQPWPLSLRARWGLKRIHKYQPADEFVAFRPWPQGVVEITAMGPETVRVLFDTSIVGARDLVEKEWGKSSSNSIGNSTRGNNGEGEYDGTGSDNSRKFYTKLAPPTSDPALAAGRTHVRHLGIMTLFSSVLTIPVLVMAWAPLPTDENRELAYAGASLALATIVQVAIAGPFYPRALKSLVFARVIEMDLLIVLSTTAAYIFSLVAFGYAVGGRPLSTGQFFETSTLLVTLIMVGRYVAALARHKAVESVSVQSLQVPSALLVRHDGSGGGCMAAMVPVGIEAEREVDVRLLQYGDVFKVLPDSTVPTDGTVIEGESEVNEAMLTGESLPVKKGHNDTVIAGSVNGPGTLFVRLSHLPGENTVSAIARMVDQAKLSKPRIQDLADAVASYFVPVVVVLTVITFVAWVCVGITQRNLSSREAAVQAITYAITVLIVSCPCAIGLAVPMVTVIACGAAAEKGIVFKSAEAIEVARKAKHIIFDKTGTLTHGRLQVVGEEYLNGQEDESEESLKSLLLALVQGIKHPVSAAISAHLVAQGVQPTSSVSDVQALAGKGVQGVATVQFGHMPSRIIRLAAGNSRWLGAQDHPSVVAVLRRNYTAFCLAVDGRLVGVFALTDSVRADAAAAVATLRRSFGATIHVVSGDDHGAVCTVAEELGILPEHVQSRCTPIDKQAYVRTLLEGGDVAADSEKQTNLWNSMFMMMRTRKKDEKPVVIFCGDGTNDAAALAQATIGVHVGGTGEGTGTDVAKSAADVVILVSGDGNDAITSTINASINSAGGSNDRKDGGGSLSAIVSVLTLSRKAFRTIIFNFGWSFTYNVVAVLLAAGAFAGEGNSEEDDIIRIPPEFAGLGELVSVVPVILAAVMLRWARI